MTASLPLDSRTLPKSPYAPRRIAVAGTGTMPMLTADALFNQHSLPVRVSLLRADPPSLKRIADDASNAVVRRVLADPRLDITYSGAAGDEFDLDDLAADTVIRVGPALTAARRRYPGGALGAVVTTGELGRALAGRTDGRIAHRLPAVTAAVVVGCARTAADLLRSGHHTVLVLDPTTLRRPSTLSALRTLVGLDLNVMVDPLVFALPATGRGAALRRAALAVLEELSEGFGAPDSPWLHVDVGWEPVEIIGVDALDAVVLATAGGDHLRTLSAQLLVLRTDSVHAIAVDPRTGGAGLARAGGARPGRTAGTDYVAVETGSFPHDHRAAHLIAAAIVRDTLGRQEFRR
jgi:hypothetical protein